MTAYKEGNLTNPWQRWGNKYKFCSFVGTKSDGGGGSGRRGLGPKFSVGHTRCSVAEDGFERTFEFETSMNSRGAQTA